MTEKLTNVGLQAYYANLAVGDRGKLLLYVCGLLGISYASASNKFSGKRQKFNNAELIALQPIISGELWRK